MPQNNQKHNNNQAGNVFIIILLGVFLFGALMYMFSRSAQQGTGNLTKQQANIAAQEILNYARLVEGAVDRVRRNGCSETEISFENNVVAGYEHTPATRDECKVFHDDGGKIDYITPNTAWLDKNSVTRLYFNETVFTSTCVNGVGENSAPTCNAPSSAQENADLIIAIPYLKEAICEEVNSAILGNTTIPTDLFHYIKPGSIFNGSFAQDSSAVNYLTSPNQTTGCLTGDSTVNYVAAGEYGFYHVLLAR